MDGNDETATAMRKVLSELNLPLNKKTEEFVYQFITDKGGIDKVKGELNRQKQTAPVPPRVPPVVSSSKSLFFLSQSKEAFLSIWLTFD